MKSFFSFCKKELLENYRTYRFIVLLAIFAVFGLMNPIVAKIIPELLTTVDLGGITVEVPEPAAIDSWMQFFKNIGQMGLLVLVIVFCGITAADLSKGTLINILTKGMKRHTVIYSKFTIAALLWTVSYLLSLIITYVYTVYYWGSHDLPYAFLAFSAPLVFGYFLISLMILGGICFKSLYGSLITTGGIVILMNLLGIFPKLGKYNPVSLSGGTLELLNGQKVPGDFIPAVIICLILTVSCIIGATLLFDRKQL